MEDIFSSFCAICNLATLYSGSACSPPPLRPQVPPVPARSMDGPWRARPPRRSPVANSCQCTLHETAAADSGFFKEVRQYFADVSYISDAPWERLVKGRDVVPVASSLISSPGPCPMECALKLWYLSITLSCPHSAHDSKLICLPWPL